MRNFIIGIFAIMLSGCGGGFKAANFSSSGSNQVTSTLCTPNAQQICAIGNGAGSQTCNSTGSAWGACGNITSCDSSFNLQGGVCVANVCAPNVQQSCPIGNGTGLQTCNHTGSVLGPCVPFTVLPITVASYSSLGDLSSAACFPDKGMAADGSGLILHLEYRPNPAEKYFTMIDGRAVSSCAAFDFPASNPTELSVTYRAVAAPVDSCSDGCSGEYCGTGGEPEIFVSPDTSRTADATWKSVGPFPRQTVMGERNISLPSSIGTVRSVLVCRNGGAPERDDVEVDSIVLLAPNGPTAAAPSAPSPYREKLTAYWNNAEVTIENQPNQIWDLFYPTMSVYSLLSGWIIDQNPTWKASVMRQIQFSHDYRLLDGLPYSETQIDSDGKPYYQYLYRDQIAREAIAEYHVYETFNNLEYLSWVDNIALKMMTLTRGTTVYKGRTYTLFYGQYEKAAPHLPVLPEGELISPNQNAENGLLFTMLYHNPHSQLYHNATALDIASNELDAAVSVQLPTGELPLTDHDQYYDTGYGGYTFALVAMANVYSQKYDDNLARGGHWLESWMSPGHYAQHMGNNLFCYGIDVNTGKSCEYPQEMWWRIPAYYKAGASLTPNLPLLYTDWLPPENGTFDGRIIFLKSAGIPRNYYLPR